jgi:hypothetical protein
MKRHALNHRGHSKLQGHMTNYSRPKLSVRNTIDGGAGNDAIHGTNHDASVVEAYSGPFHAIREIRLAGNRSIYENTRVPDPGGQEEPDHAW